MVRASLLGTYLFVLFLSLIQQQVDALRCWRCSSDSSTSAFCDDPFDPSVVNDAQRRWAFVDCAFINNGQSNFGAPANIGQNQNARPVCKKMKQLVNDKLVVSRSCAYEDVNAPADSCMRLTTPSYIRTEFCETCGHDGCNGADTIIKTSAIMLIPLVVSFLLTF